MITVNLIESNGYVDENLTKLKSALLIIERVINSDLFKQKVSEYPFYYRKKLFGGYIDKPYSNEEVLSIIENAIEYPGSINKNGIDLYLHLIDGSNGSVIGYGIRGTKEIYTYKKMFQVMEIKEIANHIVHEWLHKLGFTHAEYTTYFGKRDKSVPYAVGNFIENLAETIK
jgi:hypothetical protein